MENKLDQLYSAAIDKVNELKAVRDKYISEIAKLEEKSKILSETIETALDNSDLPTYKQATEERAQADFDIKSMRKFVNDIGSLKPGEFSEVWDAFSKEYEKRFTSAYAEYKTARKALYRQYMELYNMEKKAVKLRRIIAETCDMRCLVLDNADNTDILSIGKISGFERNPVRRKMYRLPPDATFFSDTGELPEELDEETYKVVYMKYI